MLNTITNTIVAIVIMASDRDIAASDNRPPHVAILSIPGTGHLSPAIELAKLLRRHHDLTVTIITYSNFSSPTQDALLSSATISSLSLPPVSLSDLPSTARIETQISVLIARSVANIKPLLRSLRASTNLVAYVFDIFGGDTIPSARELGIPTYMLFTSNCLLLSFMLHLPALSETTSCEYRDLPDPLRLLGCVPVRGEDFPDALQDRSDEAHEWMVHMARRFREADGILVNSFEALEPEAARVLKSEKREDMPSVWPVGPIWRSGSAARDGSGCLEWLARQPRGSVVFVSFGSGGTLSREQQEELALGLEMSEQRFLWVVRTPSDAESSGSFFGAKDSSDPLESLPEGFVSRIKDLGLVVPNWAPQSEVLGEGAVGGLLTHCGWNSTLESVMSGVPMIAWPLYAEQRMNAVMLTERARVALRAEADEEGVVRREEISKVVRELMEGEGGKAARKKVRELKEAGERALEEEGPSYVALAEVVNKWKSAKGM